MSTYGVMKLLEVFGVSAIGQNGVTPVAPTVLSGQTDHQEESSAQAESGQRHTITKRKGTVFIEARIKDDHEEDVDIEQIQIDLAKALSRPDIVFSLSADLLNKEHAHLNTSFYENPMYALTKQMLHSLKVVEYSGNATETMCTSESDQNTIPQADLTFMPHVKFASSWDELVFEQSIKSDLIWMMTNILRFSKKSGQEARDTNHLVLLHGPPGSGKTTLCQGLAQKISIRLNSTYKNTTLVQVKPAALYSKYYSESAKEVDAIFTKLQEMCENDPEEFVCVLIDEVETIATSRGSSINDDCQESLRVTNALLTGLDRTKNLINIVILCTSNMPDSLDAAFLDRCGSRIFVNSPTVQSQYGILRGRIQKLIERGIITSNKNIPCYRDADLEANDDDASESDGGRLLGLVRLINSESFGSSVIALSGRSLTQLPEQALLRYLRDETCDLGMALTLMEQYIKSEQAQAKKPKSKDDEEMDEIWEDIEVLVRRKRKYANVGEFEQALGEIEDHVATFRNNFRERKRTALELKQEKG